LLLKKQSNCSSLFETALINAVFELFNNEHCVAFKTAAWMLHAHLRIQGCSLRWVWLKAINVH